MRLRGNKLFESESESESEITDALTIVGIDSEFSEQSMVFRENVLEENFHAVTEDDRVRDLKLQMAIYLLLKEVSMTDQQTNRL